MSKSFYFKPLPPTAQNAMVWAVTLRIFSDLTWLALSHLDCKGKHGTFIAIGRTDLLCKHSASSTEGFNNNQFAGHKLAHFKMESSFHLGLCFAFKCCKQLSHTESHHFAL